MVFRRRYIKVFRDDKDRPMLAVSEFKRGVWEAFMSIRERRGGRLSGKEKGCSCIEQPIRVPAKGSSRPAEVLPG